MPPSAPQLHHVCIRVSDLQAAERFYGGLLGLTKLREFSVSAERAQALFDRRQECRFATYAGHCGQLELLWIAGETPAPAPGVHFCLALEDRDRLVADLDRAGVPRRQTEREGRRIIFIADPDGNWIELKAP